MCRFPACAALRVAILLLVGGFASAPAVAGAHGVLTLLSIDDADTPGSCPNSGVLAVPARWQYGDAAAIVIATATSPGQRHDGLITGLLAQATAVLELTDLADNCRRDTLALAREALRDTIGPGLLVVIGFGEAGEMALAASRDGFVAGIAVTEAATRIAAGPPAPPEERIDRRWPLFCGVLSANAPVGVGTCTAALPASPGRMTAVTAR